MEKDIIEMIYTAFLCSRFVKCEQCTNTCQITYVEGSYKTDIYIDLSDTSDVKVNISQESPRYPVYDLKGNVVYFGV